MRVSAKPGYREDGHATYVRRGAPATQIRLVLPAHRFVRPAWTLEVEGLERCPDLLGAGWAAPEEMGARSVIRTV